uniref:SOWAHA-C winged helix-turn-helix domain-containing protein n=1 Tax=Monopterus albus TaxID=43700 RepID=A0A3Q3IEP1_MONAL
MGCCDSVLHFLQSSGGSVKNSDLLLHFRSFIRDHADRDRNRELFKKFVNSVAIVRQENGVSYVVLKKKFRGQAPGDGTEPYTESTNLSPAASAEKARLRKLQPWEVSSALSGETASKTILPAKPVSRSQSLKSWKGGKPACSLKDVFIKGFLFIMSVLILRSPHAASDTGPATNLQSHLMRRRRKMRSHFSCRQSSVPLETREHAWLVKGAAGSWTDIYALFREDSSLLNRHDFISGFTVLHWIAKHVEKSGLTFDINARSTCGHTPLHIAAIHGNKNIMRLLVAKFNADVKLRDIAGKKPWQYLSPTIPPDMFELLGAPARAALGEVGTVDHGWVQQQQQRRRLRHNISSASSGQRPLTVAGTTKVKRSSSIAAFLKHKSLQLQAFQGHQSDSSV